MATGPDGGDEKHVYSEFNNSEYFRNSHPEQCTVDYSLRNKQGNLLNSDEGYLISLVDGGIYINQNYYAEDQAYDFYLNAKFEGCTTENQKLIQIR